MAIPTVDCCEMIGSIPTMPTKIMTASEAKQFVISIYPKAYSYLLENGTYFISIDELRFLCWEPASSPEIAWIKAAEEINEAMMYKLCN